MKFKIEKKPAQWLSELGIDSYKILREKATEAPFSGEYNIHFEQGVYKCKGCLEILFDSKSKFQSGCGWPSFDKAMPEKMVYIEDTSHNMLRTEIICASCGGHLGHVFNDGPTETKLRYCVNSLALLFKKTN